MTFRDKINLVVKGIPIVTEYYLAITEKSFKQFAESQLLKEDDMNPLSFTADRFVGNFHGYYGREFSIKPKITFFRKDSINNSIWIHGKITPIDEQNINLKITYHRTNLTKNGQWGLAGIIVLMFLTTSIQTLGNSDYLNFLILTGLLLLSTVS